MKFDFSRDKKLFKDLETYSRASSSCSSQVNSCSNSDSGLDLGRHSRPYRTDSCSIRALGGSPPSASLEDICFEEKKAQLVADVSAWLSSAEMDIDSTDSESEVPSILSEDRSCPTEFSEQDYSYASFVMPLNITEEECSFKSPLKPEISRERLTDEDESIDQNDKYTRQVEEI